MLMTNILTNDAIPDFIFRWASISIANKKKQNYSVLYYSTICLKCDQRKWKLHTAKALLIVGA